MAPKAALVGLSRPIAKELAPITANVVAQSDPKEEFDSPVLGFSW
jgi:NAD(P)-dependent dehydrogenase (short-subunit alcohol dehydrogenase family)